MPISEFTRKLIETKLTEYNISKRRIDYGQSELR